MACPGRGDPSPDLKQHLRKKKNCGLRKTQRTLYLPVQRLKINAALVPPNPKELESAYSTEAFRATFGT
jgi:hypothetical protein